MEWKAFLVSTMDHQDLRAAERWYSLLEPEERPLVQFTVNRIQESDPAQVEFLLKEILEEGDNAPTILSAPKRLQVPNSSQLAFFRRESAPSIPEELLRSLELDGTTGP